MIFKDVPVNIAPEVCAISIIHAGKGIETHSSIDLKKLVMRNVFGRKLKKMTVLVGIGLEHFFLGNAVVSLKLMVKPYTHIDLRTS